MFLSLLLSKTTAIAFASGIVLALAFPKIDLGFLAWVAFVPLVWIVWQQPLKHAFFYGWISGLGFYLCTVYWVVHTIGLYSNIPPVIALIPLFLMCSILAAYTGAFAAGVRWYKDEWHLLALFGPILWVALEWLRSFFLYRLSVAGARPILSIIPTISFKSLKSRVCTACQPLVMFGNLVIFTVLYKRGPGRGRLLLTALVVLVCVSVWGSWRRSSASRSAPRPSSPHRRCARQYRAASKVGP